MRSVEMTSYFLSVICLFLRCVPTEDAPLLGGRTKQRARTYGVNGTPPLPDLPPLVARRCPCMLFQFEWREGRVKDS